MKLSEIQQKLKAPKGQFNSFGKYKYRSCEDILESVKPLLEDASLTLSDEIVMIGNRYYVKATASFINGTITECVAYAREPENKKGMDESQITGTASSYARKYALNGLFCIDDAKDADTDEHKHQQDSDKSEAVKLTDKQIEFAEKLKVSIEENLDGQPIKMDALQSYLIWSSKQTGKPIPDSDEKINPLTTYIINKTELLNKLKGAA